MTPKFKVHGGTPRENIALQNVQVLNRQIMMRFMMHFVTFVFKGIKDDLWSIFKVKRFFCNVFIYNPQGPKETSKKYRSMCFLSSYEHLKFYQDRIQINMLK